MTSLKVQVVATSPEGTRAALGAARTLAAGLDAQVVVVVPQVVPYGEVLERPTVRSLFAGARVRALAGELSMDVEVRVCVCRAPVAVLPLVLDRDACVLVGGRRRWYWPTRDERLLASLVGQGYDALFIADRYSASASCFSRTPAIFTRSVSRDSSSTCGSDALASMPRRWQT